jgi:hypothetical protein
MFCKRFPKRFVDRCYSLIRFPVSRQERRGKYLGAGKVCVTAAICEQGDASAMGNTLTPLTDLSVDVGREVIEAQLLLVAAYCLSPKHGKNARRVTPIGVTLFKGRRSL